MQPALTAEEKDHLCFQAFACAPVTFPDGLGIQNTLRIKIR